MYSSALEGKLSSNTTTLLTEVTEALTADDPKVTGLQEQPAPGLPAGRVMVEKAGNFLGEIIRKETTEGRRQGEGSVGREQNWLLVTGYTQQGHTTALPQKVALTGGSQGSKQILTKCHLQMKK